MYNSTKSFQTNWRYLIGRFHNAVKISVLNITNRTGGIDILWANMKRQEFTDWELVIVDGRWREREEEVKEYINDHRLVYVRQSDKREGAYTNLAHADNEGFAACSGELIVCIQDYEWIGPQALSKFWYHHEQHPEGALVTGVGDQYSDPFPVDNEGKITVFDKPYTRRPENLCWSDPRKNNARPMFSEGSPVEWELNWASIPKKIIHEVGGMDEQFDYEGFAWDNTYIATKAQLLGYKIYLDQTNECMGFNHDGWWPNPLKVNRVSPQEYFVKSIQDMVSGKRSVNDGYL